MLQCNKCLVIFCIIFFDFGFKKMTGGVLESARKIHIQRAKPSTYISGGVPSINFGCGGSLCAVRNNQNSLANFVNSIPFDNRIELCNNRCMN
jgi:hypothetical protein